MLTEVVAFMSGAGIFSAARWYLERRVKKTDIDESIERLHKLAELNRSLADKNQSLDGLHSILQRLEKGKMTEVVEIEQLRQDIHIAVNCYSKLALSLIN